MPDRVKHRPDLHRSEHAISCTGDWTVDLPYPLDLIERQHKAQMALCDCLESIADSLPNEVDPAEVAHAIAGLSRDLRLMMRNEDEGLFPLLQARCEPEDRMDAILEQLSREHEIDQSFADEIIDTLAQITDGTPVANADMLGYMLRGFFESHRRHLRWELEVTLPIARKRLLPGDLQELGERLEAHRASQQLLDQVTAAAPEPECACRNTGYGAGHRTPRRDS